MLCDAFQGGTVAAATPQRVGNMDSAASYESSANPIAINFGEADPSIPVKT